MTIASSSTTVLPSASESRFSPQKEEATSVYPSISVTLQPSVLDLAPELPLVPISLSSSLPPPSHRLLATTLPPTISPSKAIPLSIITHSTMSNAKGPAAMPAPHSNKAPFFGDQTGDTIEVFLREFESLALTYALTPRERIEQILCYVSPELCDLWQFLDGYASKDWQTFRQSIQEIYGGASVMSRYSKQRL